MAGYGTPIRLIFDDPIAMAEFGYAEGMELMAESIAIGVDRSIGGMPIPFSGGRRMGLDLNMSNSLIQIDGIFADDDMIRSSGGGKASTAVIDFGVEMNDAVNNDDLSSITEVSASRYSTIEAIRLFDVAGNMYTITFSISGSVGTVSGSSTTRDIVVWDGSSTYISSTQLATAFVTAIAAASSSAITGAVTESEYLGTNTAVTFTQGTTGSVEGASIQISHRGTNDVPLTPYFSNFSGGYSTSTNKSAGDKVQDLYGILNNTSRRGSAIVGGLVMGGATAAAIVATGGTATPFLVGGAAAGLAAGGTAVPAMFSTKGDYPIGIQIPYNSMVQAADGDRYAVRNFLVPTGNGKEIRGKMSDGNTNAASTEFDTRDNSTGIQGAIQSFTATFDAGEQVYGFKLTFVPIDVII